ncbi:indolepyruvate ferredoxin oxidoreductase family protein [Jiella sp. MQZ9-1]|uniref:Indolepyruvate ferredoxin oxidoreductase family protein n=1 Tax=Jiella flava TaxID=2816857 RepID=A0A939FTG2_9HYPH|nr:indolepyruvate ferredoxin oxidoreductase family protein [Jiella flava]MBO0661628.1 indolepyruvate ferredoxin oxidoreductase family protein [Jiella flava]MCD2470270.1 indolepyruvate ferredoxin oxidoreductase family protein [Jiella flava]
MAVRRVALRDRIDLDVEDVLLSGSQAVVRLLLMQAARDRAAGLSTAGYVSGYRGSPLGGLDQQFSRAAGPLGESRIVFEPGLNEDLAATALWGSQQAELRGEGRYDGVFGLWYGKGPGVDRSGDAFRHANLAGTSRHGGVLALLGDDHTCESSTSAHQSEFAAIDAMMPILHPAGVQEILDYGLAAYALSRFSGLWTTMKCIKDAIESTATVKAALDRTVFVLPDDRHAPGYRNIRRAAHPLEQEAMVHEHRLPAVQAFVAMNGLNRIVHSGGRTPRIGILSLGKSWLDVEQALVALGIDEVAAAGFGLRLGKVAVPWPLDLDFVRRFAAGLELVIVVEEKRGVVEPQVKDILYGMANAPGVVGKRGETGGILFKATGALDSNEIALVIGQTLADRMPQERLAARLSAIETLQQHLGASEEIAVRTPYFCAGCPHNSSTRVPDGARAYAGIGCHYMVQWMDRATEGYTQMGAEGANWIGERHFSTRDHVFQNLGDGTYNHSGLLALRAAAASGANVTYKILYNDAVAMTGGQAHEGQLSVPMIAAQVAAEGAKRVVIVSDAPETHRGDPLLPAGVTLHHRRDLNAVQRDLATIEGLTVLIFDQTCAAEKRRRRKRGRFPDPDRRVVINTRVCEGCGDCGVQSNCVAIAAVETPFGRKRQIDQSACNKDFSCLEGFCPALVTVEGGALKAVAGMRREAPATADPAIAEPQGAVGIVITGVGGTGVVTVGALIAMAAHLDGRGAGIIDMAGLAQKGGPVTSHVRIAPAPGDVKAIRVAAGEATLVIGCDLVTAGSAKVRAALRHGKTAVVLDTHETLSGEFTRNVDFSFPNRRLIEAIEAAAGEANVNSIDAEAAARTLFGNTIFANILMLGLAYQTGALPVSRAALREAIRLNGVDVETNLAAFEWGRALFADPAALPVGAGAHLATAMPGREALDPLIARRARDLAAYQDVAYAKTYEAKVMALREAEHRVAPGKEALTATVARELYRLMAIKDEYEVARLYTDGGFAAEIAGSFERHKRLTFHLAPPIFGEDGSNGRPAKRPFGPWMMQVFKLLAAVRQLRGGLFDPFRFSAERKAQRCQLAAYRDTLDAILAGLTPERYEAALQWVRWPEGLNGFGPVRQKKAQAADLRRRAAEAAFFAAESIRQAAE